MINLAQIRRSIETAPGDAVGMTKEQALLLVAVAETAQQAQRRLSPVEAVAGVISGAARVAA